MKNTNNKFRILMLTAYSIGLFAFLLSGCSDNPVLPVNKTQNGSANLDFSSVETDNPVVPNPGILVLTEAKVMVKDVMIHAEGREDDSCEIIKTGPFVLQLKLNTTINIVSGIYVPNGLYDDVKFRIHKLSPEEPLLDPDFEDINGRYSVIVKGTYYGNSFIFRSSVTATQKLDFSKAITFGSEKANITLLANPIAWFTGSNNIYLNPASSIDKTTIDKNIRENIHNSFKIFKDNDKNGLPDD